MKISLKPTIAKAQASKPELLPTSMNVNSLPSLTPPKLGTLGPKFRYKGAREK